MLGGIPISIINAILCVFEINNKICMQDKLTSVIYFENLFHKMSKCWALKWDISYRVQFQNDYHVVLH